MSDKPTSVDEYIAGFPKDAQKALKEMRSALRKATPKAEEGLKWGMPAFSYSRILFTYAAFKSHVSLYPTPAVVKAFAKDLTGYKTSSSAIQFPLNKSLPKDLIQRMAAFRVRESVEKDARWM